MKPKTHSYSIVWLATLLFFGSFYALLVPLPLYLMDIRLSDWQIGVVLGVFGVASLVGRPIAGATVDRIGSRPVLLAGAAALLAGCLGVLATRSMAVLMLLRLLQAGGYVAFTTASTVLVVQLTPPELRTQRLAVFGIAANLAITLAPAAMSALLQLLPLADGFALAGALALLAGALAACVPAPSGPGAAPAQIMWRPPRALWAPMLISALFGAAFAAFFQFAPILAERRGDLSAGWLYTVYGISIIATRLAGGRLAGRAPVERVLLAAAISMALGLSLIALAPPAPLLLLAMVLIAAGSGTFHPTLIAHHVALLPQAPGQATASFYIGFDLGIGAGSWLLGALLQGFGLGGLYAGAALLAVLVLPLLRYVGGARRALAVA